MLSNSRTGTHNIFIFSIFNRSEDLFLRHSHVTDRVLVRFLCVQEKKPIKSVTARRDLVFMSRKGHRVSLWSMPGGCWLPWSRKPTEEMTVPSVISITVQMYTQCTPHRSLQDILNRGLFPSLYSKLYNSPFSKRCT